MRPRCVALLALSSCLLTFVPSMHAARPNTTCNLPPSLQGEIAVKYPGATFVTLADLREDDEQLFQKEHRDACPGVAKVDFYGDRQPTWALALISGDGATQKTELVVAHQVGKAWKITSLETAKSSVPVVWSQGPGTYRDVYGAKIIRAKRSVIVFGEYSAWIIVYVWTGKQVDKVWLID